MLGSTAFCRVVAALTFLVAAVAAQGQAYLTQTLYNHMVSGNETPAAKVMDSAGNLYVLGNTGGEVLFEKLDPKLNEVWQTVWDSPSDQPSSPVTIGLNANGSVFAVASWLLPTNGSPITNVSVLTLNENSGAVSKVTTPISSANISYPLGAVDGKGYAYLCGDESVTDGVREFVAKIDPAAGSVLFNTLVANSANANQGNLMLAVSPGAQVCLYGNFPPSSSSAAAAFTAFGINSTTGATTWEYQKPLSSDPQATAYGYGAAFDSAGNPIVVGTELVNSTSGFESLAMKLNGMNGNPVWITETPSPNYAEAFYSVAVDPSGNVFAAGMNFTGTWYALIVKLNGTTGAAQWTETLQYANAATEVYDIATDSAGDALIQANDWPKGSGGPVYLDTALFNPSGIQQWADRYPSNNVGNANPFAIFAANDGIYSIGTSDTTATRGDDILVQNLATATGALTYQALIDYTTHATDQTMQDLREADGSVVEVGVSYAPVYTLSPLITLFSPTGAVLWSDVLPSTDWLYESSFKAALAPDGSIYLAITTQGTLSIYKFAKATGNMIWQTTYIGDLTANPQLQAMCAAPNGDLVLAMGTNDEVTPTNPILRFSAAKGALLWTTGVNFGGSSHDMYLTNALALPDGSIVFAGTDYQNDQNQKALIFRINADGSAGWSLDQANNASTGGSLVEEIGGDVVFIGGPNSYALRVNGATGAVKWFVQNVPPGTFAGDYTMVSALDASGNIFVGTQNAGHGNPGVGIAVQKISPATGKTLWTGTRFVIGDVCTPISIMVDYDDCPEVISSDLIQLQQTSSKSVLKFDSGGTLQWDVPITFPNARSAVAVGVGASASGNVGFGGTASFRLDQFGHGVQTMSIIARQSTAAVTFTGTARLGDYVGDPTQVPLTIHLRNAGSSAALQSRVIYIEKGGTFKFEACTPPGSYDITLEGPHWLRQKFANVTVAGSLVTGLSYSLVNGDVTGDNVVSRLDLETLIQAIGTSPGQSGYNPNADLNGDGKIDVTDESILKKNYGQKGAG